MKEAARSLRRATGSRISNMAAYKQKLTTLLFIEQRYIKLLLPDGAEIETFTHIVRGETPKGPRVAPTTSLRCPADTLFDCCISVLGEAIKEADLRELLDFGALQGMGKWRSGGWGRFTYTLKRMRDGEFAADVDAKAQRPTA